MINGACITVIPPSDVFAQYYVALGTIVYIFVWERYNYKQMPGYKLSLITRHACMSGDEVDELEAHADVHVEIDSCAQCT